MPIGWALRHFPSQEGHAVRVDNVIWTIVGILAIIALFMWITGR